MTEEEKVQRGEACKLIKNNRFYAEAVETVRSELMKSFITSKPSDSDQRENIYLAIQMLDRVQQELIRSIENGEVSKKQLARLSGKNSIVRNFYPV